MFSSKDKSAKEKALQDLMDLLDKGGADDLRGIKGKPADAEISVVEDDKPQTDFAKKWAEMKGESPASDDSEEEPDDDEPSDEEKQRIAELYSKYCK